MGLTRKRDLAAVAAAVAVIGYLAIHVLYRYFPPITLWTGLSLLAVAAVEAGWAVSVRGRIREGRIGVGRGAFIPWWRRAPRGRQGLRLGGSRDAGLVGRRVRIPVVRRAELAVAAADFPGAVVAAVSALASSSRRCGWSTAASPRRIRVQQRTPRRLRMWRLPRRLSGGQPVVTRYSHPP